MELSQYDKETLEYLEGVGVKGALLDRVRRLANEAATATAEAEAWKKAAHEASKAGA